MQMVYLPCEQYQINVTTQPIIIPEDQRIFDGLRNLDPQIVSATYDRYFAEVYRFIRYRLNDDAVAEDITSDVFVRLLEASRAGRAPQTNLRAWLLSTAAHIVTDHLRRHYRRPTETLAEDVPDGGTSDPSADYEQQERERRLKTALAQLTEEQQSVITLRFSEGLSLEETASIMKKNINAIKQLQFRALAALNRQLEEIP